MVFEFGKMRQLLAAACATMCLGLVTMPAMAQTVLLDKVIAIVDGDVILASEFQGRLAMIEERMKAQGQEIPPDNALGQEVLDRMILERIQLQMGERVGVRFSDAEINEAMSTIAAQSGMSLEQFRLGLEAQGKSYAALRQQVVEEMTVNSVQQGNLRSRIQVTDQDVDNFLRSEEGQQRTAASYRIAHLLLPLASDATPDDETAAHQYLEQLQAELQAPDAFQAMIAAPPQAPYALSGGDLGWRPSDGVPSIFAEAVPTLSVGEISAPIRSASGYHLVKLIDKRGGGGQTVNQTLVRHILVKPSEIRSNAQAEELASSLRQRIVDGEDFTVLAREFSEDYGSAQEGGELGWSNPGQMVPEFEVMMNSTQKESLSPVFATEYGWHFLEVMDRRVQDVSLEMQRNQARNILYSERFDEERLLWLRKIRDEAFVEIKL